MAELTLPLNLEMAATGEMQAIALRHRPHAVCIVPERREERTTEGGLDLVAAHAHLVPAIFDLTEAGIRVSLFIEPDARPIETAAMLGAPVVELHTGTWCNAVEAGDEARADHELERLRNGARWAAELGLEVHAGHGLNFETSETLAAVPWFAEFNTGHFLIGEAIFVGLAESLRRVRAAMAAGRARAVE